jgi:hypothetical protein
MQARHAPVHVELQHTPSTQLLEVHSTPPPESPQAAPLAFLARQLPATESQYCHEVQPLTSVGQAVDVPEQDSETLSRAVAESWKRCLRRAWAPSPSPPASSSPRRRRTPPRGNADGVVRFGHRPQRLRRVRAASPPTPTSRAPRRRRTPHRGSAAVVGQVRHRRRRLRRRPVAPPPSPPRGGADGFVAPKVAFRIRAPSSGGQRPPALGERRRQRVLTQVLSPSWRPAGFRLGLEPREDP